MTEILTESFCERCGTRYTFESAVPKNRLRRVKVMSRGLKNFVLDDQTSFDEAMASARSDTDRDATSHQLDAFHKTFSFCMQCRQYTCPNCWNEAEGRCLSCAPLGTDLAAATAPNLDRALGLARAEAAAEVDAASEPGEPLVASTNGHATDDETNGFDPIARLDALTLTEPISVEAAPIPAEAVPAEPIVDPIDATVIEPPTGFEAVVLDLGPELAASTPTDAAPAIDAPTEDGADEGMAAPDRVSLAPHVVVPDPAIPEPVEPDEPPLVASFLATAPGSEDLVIEVVPEPGIAALEIPDVPEVEVAPVPVAEPVVDIAVEVEAAAEPDIETLDLSGELETLAPAEPGPALDAGLVFADIKPGESLDDALAAYMDAEPAAVAEPEPVVAEPEPVVAEPEADVEAAPTPPPAVDIVEQPTWSIVAPDPATVIETRIVPPPPAEPTPTWPSEPQWPSHRPSPGLPFLGRPAVPTGGVDALWAESDRAVTSSPSGPGKPATTVQSCISCGLSLSASARFCRRCGTSQVR